MEKSFKQMLINEIESRPRGFMEELAKKIGYSSGSALRKILNDPKKEFDKFQSLILLVKELFENEFIEMMILYSKEVDVNKKISRNFLEFLVHNRQFEAFNELLDRMNQTTNKESLEWARIYRMQYKYGLVSKEEFNALLKEITEINVTVFELKVYKKILMNYCFEQIKEYGMVKQFSTEIENEVDQIENTYIKEMYSIRFNEIMSYNYLFVYNDQEKSRECAEKILEINTTLSYKAYANYIIGYSYLFTSYENTIKYFNKSVDMYEKLNRQRDINELKEDVEFANVLWDKDIENGCKFEKNEILSRIKKGANIQINCKEIEFKLFFEGMKNKDNDKLLLSLIEFTKNDNLFLANLPKIELMKNGYNEEIINGIINIKLA